MNKIFPNNIMALAIKKSQKLLDAQLNLPIKQQEIPVVAIIVDINTNQIIATAHNTTIKSKNPLAHAEILAINKTIKKLKTSNLQHYAIYSTLEPCLMCSGAIKLAKIKQVYFASYSYKFTKFLHPTNQSNTHPNANNPANLAPSSNGSSQTSNIELYNTCENAMPGFIGGIYEEESTKILNDFFKLIRHSNKNSK